MLGLVVLAADLLDLLLLGTRGVRIDTVPKDARVRFDEVLALHWGNYWLMHPGSYRLLASAPGYQGLSQVLEVADTPDQRHTLTLEPLPGHLALTTTPAGATISLDGSARGTAPLLQRDLPAGRHRLEARLPGYQTIAQDIVIDGRGQTQELALELAPEPEKKPEPAPVKPVAKPASPSSMAQPVAKSGSPAAPPAAPTPAAAARAAQPVPALSPAPPAPPAALPMTMEAPGGGSLRLFRPDTTFTLGAGRREQGRRSDQVERQVQLQRPFYLGVHEVTNAQYRRFQRGHSSSHAGGKTLDLAAQPVVRVSWTEAARFCNWLSREAGLQPFYQESGGRISGVDAAATGYRLPTEAEWEWAARSEPGGGRRTFPWGESFPPPAASENIAGAEAADLIAGHLAAVDDGFAVSAPVGSFPANARGLADLGGNVAEWVHDFYEVPLPGAAPARDPLGPARGSAHVIRGPSWRHGGLVELRLAYRDQGEAGRDDVGFRLARYAE